MTTTTEALRKFREQHNKALKKDSGSIEIPVKLLNKLIAAWFTEYTRAVAVVGSTGSHPNGRAGRPSQPRANRERRVAK